MKVRINKEELKKLLWRECGSLIKFNYDIMPDYIELDAEPVSSEGEGYNCLTNGQPRCPTLPYWHRNCHRPPEAPKAGECCGECVGKDQRFDCANIECPCHQKLEAPKSKCRDCGARLLGTVEKLRGVCDNCPSKPSEADRPKLPEEQIIVGDTHADLYRAVNALIRYLKARE